MKSLGCAEIPYSTSLFLSKKYHYHALIKHNCSFISVIRAILIFLTVFSILKLNAQTFDYTFPQPIISDSGIDVRWVINAGSTCEGMEVEHGTDTSSLTKIHEVFGVCGSANFDIPYRFLHENPVPNQVNYYRIKFGKFDLSQINEVFLLSVSVLVKPNPGDGAFKLFFENPERQEVKIEVFEFNGKLISSFSTNDSRALIDLQLHANGVYVYRLVSNSQILEGKLVKQ